LNERDTALAIRLLLGRQPREEEVDRMRQHRSIGELRRALLRSREAKEILDEEKSRPEYRVPLFLLRPPPPGVPWRFAAPDLEEPVTQLCTHEQITSPAYARWCEAMKVAPRPHRKQWEFVWILAALDRAGALRPGARLLGFGCGREPLPSYLAGRGIDVLATDAPPEIVEKTWGLGNQHSSSQDDLRREGLATAEEFARHVAFRDVDMNDIPADLTGFDACWSACALEHLGSIERGLSFIENSLACLKPAGVAVHTTEFNLASNDATFESDRTCLFRKRDIEGLLQRLAGQGHEVWPLNLHPGTSQLDEVIDLPPFSPPHLKVALRGHVSTSIGIAVRRRAA
jgi:2-polyprenyl-3-methyl-5-hydroxy-6-metoxy-1,4-benzoquinol methylase